MNHNPSPRHQTIVGFANPSGGGKALCARRLAARGGSDVTTLRKPLHEYEERDGQIWGDVTPLDGIDLYAREADPFYRQIEDDDDDDN